MPLAPLRPRRRRSTDAALPTARAGTGQRPVNLSSVAARIAGLIDGPVSEALVVMLTELYGDAIARMLVAIEGAGESAEILDRLCADPLVGALLVVHDLHPQPLADRIQRALDTFEPFITQPARVTLERIEDDVVYLRFSAASDASERDAIARAIAEIAPEISHVHADVPSEGEFAIFA